jgi:hypothetical protein
LLHGPVTLSSFGPNILLNTNTMFSDALGLCSSHNVRPSFAPKQNHRQNIVFQLDLRVTFIPVDPCFSVFHYLLTCISAKFEADAWAPGTWLWGAATLWARWCSEHRTCSTPNDLWWCLHPSQWTHTYIGSRSKVKSE